MRWWFPTYGRLFVLIIIYLLLSTGYNLFLSLGSGNDEFGYFRYIRFIAKHHRLPLNQDERGEASYISFYPPLYPGLAGLLFFWIDTDKPLFKPIRYGQIPQQALIYETMNVSWILPTEVMEYPYRGTVLLWHLSRFLSTLLSAGVIVVTYFTTLELFPGKKSSALMAAATLAFMPRFVFSGSTITVDSLVTLLMAIYLFLTIRLTKGNERWWHFSFIGVVLGLALTTKFSVGFVPLTTVLFFGFLAWQRRWPPVILIKRIAITLLSIGATAGWWFVFIIWNFSEIETKGLLPGLVDAILPTGVVNAVSGSDFLATLQGVKEPVAREPLSDWLIYLGQSIWVLNLPSWLNNATWADDFPWILKYRMGPQIFWVSSLVLGFIIVGLVMTWRRANNFQRTGLTLFLLHILSFFPLMLVRHYMSGKVAETAQGHHIVLPAALAIGILMMAGWSYWVRPKTVAWIRPVLPALLLFWSIAQLNFLYHNFPQPLPLVVDSASEPQIDTPVNLMLFDAFEFVGYSTQFLTEQSALEVMLAWRGHNPSPKDYLTEVRLVNEAGQIVSSWIQHPANGLYPTRVWFGWELVYNRATLPLYNLTPGVYTVEAYLLEAYQQPAPIAAGPLFSTPITLENVANRRPDFKNLFIKTGDEIVRVSYQRWPFNFFDLNRPTYRHRTAIPIIWESNLPSTSDKIVILKLVGPDGHAFEPLNSQGNLQTFIVGPDWPSGAYRLSAVVMQNGDVIGENISPAWFEVQNKTRQFTPPAFTRQVEANFYNHIKLLGYDLLDSRIQPGEELPIVVYWQSLQTVNGNLQMFNHLYDANNNLRATFDRVPPPHYGGPIAWTPGQIIADGYTIPTNLAIPEGIYTLRAGFFLGLSDNAWFPLPLISDGQISDVDYVVLGPIKIGSAPQDVLAVNPAPEYPRYDNLNNLIELVGYDLDYSLEKQEMHLVFYWKSLAVIEKNYTAFVHIQNEQGQIIAQHDNPPTGGIYPTSLWETNEVIKDEVVLTLPAGGIGDNYKFLIGMYDFATGERLIIPDADDNAISIAFKDALR